ncbi:hypothetical protein BaRGS_00014701 [Batillaria attramentaria]|uniref:Uncharacterized protein n=1 Tax=Batillaria attramentaria TaxID=370345 RepID=A0ABD0L497_9CAEN
MAPNVKTEHLTPTPRLASMYACATVVHFKFSGATLLLGLVYNLGLQPQLAGQTFRTAFSKLKNLKTFFTTSNDGLDSRLTKTDTNKTNELVQGTECTSYKGARGKPVHDTSPLRPLLGLDKNGSKPHMRF